ncbi:calcium:proton antiporter [Sphingobacterium populi]
MDHYRCIMFLKEVFTFPIIARLAFIWLVASLFLFSDSIFIESTLSNTMAITVFFIILITIIIASYGAVAQADKLANLLGEPYGTLILTLSIVSIEVVLIAAMMLGPTELPSIGKDSIFSVMMIIMNLVIGLCILVGSAKHKEQNYNGSGALTYIAMISILGGFALILPNYIIGNGSGEFSFAQAMTIATLILLIYAQFLKYQMTDYRHLYVQPESPHIITASSQTTNPKDEDLPISSNAVSSSRLVVYFRVFLLFLMILPIVLLSHDMATIVDFGIRKASLPPALGGVLIAIIVFIPESMTALNAALNNEFQRTINLCHGAFVSTVGLTVPTILFIGLLTSKTVRFGLNSTELVLFLLTLFLSLITFHGKRTSPILGMLHLALFALFILLLFNP